MEFTHPFTWKYFYPLMVSIQIPALLAILVVQNVNSINCNKLVLAIFNVIESPSHISEKFQI